MDAIWLAASGAVALLGSLGSGYWATKRARRPLERRIAELEDTLGVERSTHRRRADEHRRAIARAHERARALVGLPPERAGALRGAALARALVDRLSGLAAVEAVCVVDQDGLAWASSTPGPSLEAVAGAALRLETAIGAPLREIHIETIDVRHLSVRPLIGTLPRLALATVTSSRRTPAFALDAATAFAGEACGAGDDTASIPAGAGAGAGASLGGVGLGAEGFAPTGTSLSADVDSAVAREVARELDAARESAGVRGLSVMMGDAILASSGDLLPSRDVCLRITRSATLLAASAERRIGQVRRIDLATLGGTATVSRLGRSGKLTLLAFDVGGGVEDTVIDRLVGRLRRFVPPQPTVEMGTVSLA